MTVYANQLKKGPRWYFHFLSNGKYYRGGMGFSTKGQATEAEDNKRKSVIRLNLSKQRQHQRKYFQDKPARNTQAYLKKHHAMSLEQYNALLLQQGGVCGICGDPPNKKKLYIDHDHVTGEIRGLLCHRCNTGIGILGDTYTIVVRALHYLLNFEASHVHK